MTNATPEEDGDTPVERMAKRLLAEARGQPELIGRPVPVQRPGLFPPMALLADPTTDIRRYLEDLVSIAVSSAQQAEEVSAQAQAASRKARRGMLVVASFAALGVLVGVAGFAASRSANMKLAEVRGDLAELQDMHRAAQSQLAELAKPMEPAPATAAWVPPASPAAPERALPLPPSASASVPEPAPPALMPAVYAAPEAAPAWQPPRSSSATPWPDSRPTTDARSTARRVTQPNRGLFSEMGHNIRAFFRSL